MIRLPFRISVVGSLLALTILTGCSFGSFKASPAETPPLQTYDDESIPFSLQVLDEVNDGTELHILAAVVSKAPWNAQSVLVKLSGMNSGEVTKSVDLPLVKALKRDGPVIIDPGEQISFALSLPVASMTDYQLELLWGGDAAKSLKLPRGLPGEQAAKVTGVVLKDLATEKINKVCSTPPCGANYMITGRVFNAGPNAAAHIVVGVGFVWKKNGAELDLSNIIPQDEEKLELEGITLAVGEGRRLQLELDREVPETQGGVYQAVARVVNFSKF